MSTENAILVTIESLSDDATVARGAVIDISPTGASLGTDHPFPASAMVRVHMRYTSTAHEDELLGRVVTVETAATDNRGYYARTVVKWLDPNGSAGSSSLPGGEP
jgi:hypothetical protein